jgi:hypothetical protein
LNLKNYGSCTIKMPSTNKWWLAIVCKYCFYNLVSSSARSFHVYITILTMLCRLKIVECKRRQVYDIGFVNPNTVNEWSVIERYDLTYDNLLTSFLKNHHKSTILLPYKTKWVLITILCIFCFAYSMLSVIDELCVHIFHFILLVIKLEEGKVTVLDSLRQGEGLWVDMREMLQK